MDKQFFSYLANQLRKNNHQCASDFVDKLRKISHFSLEKEDTKDAQSITENVARPSLFIHHSDYVNLSKREQNALKNVFGFDYIIAMLNKAKTDYVVQIAYKLDAGLLAQMTDDYIRC